MIQLLLFEGIFQADVEGGGMMGSRSPRCTLVLSSGVVHSLADGLPSQPVDFGSYFFKLKDNGCVARVAGWVFGAEDSIQVWFKVSRFFTIPLESPI